VARPRKVALSAQSMRNTWLREIRKECREWAEAFDPGTLVDEKGEKYPYNGDIVPFQAVKDALFVHLINNKKNFWMIPDQVNQKIFAQTMAWNPIKTVVIAALRKRGYRMMPAIRNGSNIPPWRVSSR
jgi:hypothetical protein